MTLSMKKLFLLSCFVFFLFAGRLGAQGQVDFSRFELSLSVGSGVVLTDGKVGDTPSFPINFDVSFMYFPKAWLSVGLALGNDSLLFFNSSRKVALTPCVRFHWLRKEIITLYSGLGYSIVVPYLFSGNTAGRRWYEDFQVNPVGITFGRSVFGFAELGFGARQIIPPLRLGVGYRF